MLVNVFYENEAPGEVEHIKDIAQFALEHLSIDGFQMEIDIYVDEIAGKVNGMVVDQMDEGKFIVMVQNGRSLQDMLMTVVHELIHVKQYLKDGLDNHMDSMDTIPYLERWWEIEAFSLTKVIVQEYILTL